MWTADGRVNIGTVCYAAPIYRASARPALYITVLVLDLRYIRALVLTVHHNVSADFTLHHSVSADF